MSEDITSVFRMSQDILDIKICQNYTLTQQPPSRCHTSSDVRRVRYGFRHGPLSQSVRDRMRYKVRSGQLILAALHVLKRSAYFIQHVHTMTESLVDIIVFPSHLKL